MTYYLIGSGNMAWFLAARMQSGGHTCAGIMGRNTESVSALAREYNFPVVQSINDGADACLLAVSDHAIHEIAEKTTLKTTVLLHHSGAVNINVLTNAAVHAGVVWPVYSILKKDLPVHRQFPCLYETNSNQAQKVALEVCNALSGIRYETNSAQRLWMHLAAVVGNNFTNQLLSICMDICKTQQVPFSILQPILQQTIDRANIYNPHDMQTGPAKRNDTETQMKHMDLIAGNPYWQAVYTALSAAIRHAHHNQ